MEFNIILNTNDIFSIDFEQLKTAPPYYFFVKRNVENKDIYNKGISLEDIFITYNSGLKLVRENVTLDFTKDALLAKLHDFAYLDEQTARDKYKLTQDSRNWKLPIVQQFLKSVNINAKYVKSIVYKPFDVRYTYYTDRKKGIVERSGYSINIPISLVVEIVYGTFH
ncbi:hypothetical protein bcCo53_001695 (plasmid) [Borrelia coriaceae]|nr:hypothetical protein bcCo53_001695 [Borrelia coriaceae]